LSQAATNSASGIAVDKVMVKAVAFKRRNFMADLPSGRICRVHSPAGAADSGVLVSTLKAGETDNANRHRPATHRENGCQLDW
jgi:hypothetical protein